MFIGKCEMLFFLGLYINFLLWTEVDQIVPDSQRRDANAAELAQGKLRLGEPF